MNEPTREECERRFPQLKADSKWELCPLVGRGGTRDFRGFVCIYHIGGRTFATPIVPALPDRPEKGEEGK